MNVEPQVSAYKIVPKITKSTDSRAIMDDLRVLITLCGNQLGSQSPALLRSEEISETLEEHSFLSTSTGLFYVSQDRRVKLKYLYFYVLPFDPTSVLAGSLGFKKPRVT